MDDLTLQIKQEIQNSGPVTLETLCVKLHLWPKDGIKRRLQLLRKNGKIEFTNNGWINVIEYISPESRAIEKQISIDKDTEDLLSGAKSFKQINEENLAIKITKQAIDFSRSKSDIW